MRHPQWPDRLSAFIAEQRTRPYEFGRNDCVLFPANAVKTVTGKDYARGHRGKYNSLVSAYAYLRKTFGVDSPAALIDTLLPEKIVGFAQRGDIVLCRVDVLANGQPGEVPGLCMGTFAFVAGEHGLERVPRTRWLKAWSVGGHHSGERAHP